MKSNAGTHVAFNNTKLSLHLRHAPPKLNTSQFELLWSEQVLLLLI